MAAPVAIFAYTRLDLLRGTIEALMANTMASATDVYVFSDGGKDAKSWQAVEAVRSYVRSIADRARDTGCFKSVTLVARPENVYLENNIISGIGQVLESHDAVIVVEDDIQTSPYFLKYVNDALETYRDDPRVMHVAGFTNLDLADSPRPFYFTPHPAGWGWATWRDRWQKHFVHYQSRAQALAGLTDEQISAIEYGGAYPALKLLDKSPIPWDICWEIAVRRAGGLAVTPSRTLVRNTGIWEGTHFGLPISSPRIKRLLAGAQKWLMRRLQWYEYDREPSNAPVEVAYAEPAPDPAIEAAFAKAITHWGIRYTPLGKVVRKIYKSIKSE